MRIRDVMHEPVQTCSSATTLTEAARRMTVAEVGALVVVDEQQRPVGVVTDRDLALRGVVTAGVDDDVFEAASTMAARGVRRLAVLDAGRLAGVISLDDLSILLSHEMADIGRAVAAQADTRHYAGWAGWD